MTDFTGIDAYEFLIIEWDSKNVRLLYKFQNLVLRNPYSLDLGKAHFGSFLMILKIEMAFRH